MKTEKIKIRCNGFQFELEAPQDDYITKILKKTHKFYEQDFLLHLLKKYGSSIQTDEIIIDVGAYIGNHSLFFNRFFNCEVYAFEPNLEIFGILQENCNFRDIKLHTIALLDSTGFVSMQYKNKNNKGTYRLVEESKKKKRIPIKPLDNMELSDIALIKIDVEGNEAEVLYGAEETIRDNQPIIVLESWDIIETMNTCGRFLFNLGYDLQPIFKSKEKQLNLEFTPESFHG